MQPIKFEDIRVGDTIRHVSRGVTVEGTVGYVAPYGLKTAENGYLVDDEDAGELYLLARPAPPEPTGLGAVVEAHSGEAIDPDPVRNPRRLMLRGHPGLGAGSWWDENGNDYGWSDLVNPEVKSEGWVE